MRVRLKADGRIVEVRADGSEGEINDERLRRVPSPPLSPEQRADAAVYARSLRDRTKLTQAQFAQRIGVPIETVRNWEQGKREPRGPARALLRVIEQAPDLAFRILGAPVAL